MDPTPPIPTPPSEPDPYAVDDLLHEPPKWPKVIGTISIVWGGLSLMCAGCGVAQILFTPQLMKMGEAQFGPAPAVMMPGPIQLVAAAAGLLITILLIVAGIFTVSRSPAGRLLHLVWAALSVVTGLIGVAVGIRQQMAIMEWARQNPDNPWAQQQNPLLTVVIFAFVIVLSFAWPVFCLIWFGLVKRTPESMTGSDAGV